MQRNLRDPPQGEKTETPLNESERLMPPPTRTRAPQYYPEPPTKLSRPDLSFLNDDQRDQKHLSVTVSREQAGSRHNNQQEFQTDEDVSRELGEAYSARKQSKQKIRELWKAQGSDGNEEDEITAETRRAQFFLDLELAQKEFDHWDDRMKRISLARGRKGFSEPYMSGANHTSNPYNWMPPRTFNQAPSQSQPNPQSPPQVPPLDREPVPVQKREVVRGRDVESGKEPQTVKPTPSVDVHIDPKARRDITLHLDMDVTEDVEEELEEFSRLRRIGHFKAAKRYFERHLESCIDNAKFPALCCNQDFLTNVQLQFLINDLRVVRHGDTKNEYTDEGYGKLYAHLQHEDRIWDFRDLCYSIKATASLEMTIDCIFSKYLSQKNNTAPSVVQIIQQHWDGSAEDEVTSLALLDIFTAFAMWALEAANSRYEDSLDDTEELQTAKIYLDAAHHYATEVMRQNPLNLKSRPYLQWVVAKVLVQKNTDPARSGQFALRKHLCNMRGETNTSAGAFRGLLPFSDIVVYTPNEDEAPDWQPDSSITFSHEQEQAIQMVARHARQLGDVLLEAACLQQLNYSSPSTEVYLVDLCNLWRSAGNRLGLLRAYVYRYILKRTINASNDLRSDLLEFGDTQCRVQLQKARFMILRALSTRLYEKAVYLRRAQDLDDIETTHSAKNNGRKGSIHSESSYSDDEPQSPTYRKIMRLPPRDIETTHSANNNGRQASIHSDQSYSDDYETDHSDNDDANKNGPSAVRPQRPISYRFRRPTLDEEKPSQKNEDSPRQILAGPFNEADQTELIPSGPATNTLPVRLHSMEMSKDSKHRKKNILRSDSRKTTKESRYGEGTIDLVDEQDNERREEKENGQ
ncbi:hypothetical protein CKAH01_16411 [Colletotrichum kahawae]|uniref:Uncharacterized protein n=1 Tax=Colletotrichum kahawae TaxID=34407 RepID=A0AAD9YG67_COLKA|nr:hypothetical protein CKAH01_16411 [Colletotrichum kahawae]